MKKSLIIIALILTATTALKAQNANSSASQTVKLALSNAIEITFVSTDNNVGNTTTLSFNTVNDYANGVESGTIQLRVRSNKKFEVKAKTTAKEFSYAGSTNPAPKMDVKNILFLQVTDNNTGGKVQGSVNNKYKSLDDKDLKLIKDGTPGGNNTFSVQYKADPGFEFPAGTYTVDVLYTATQK